MKSTPDSVHIRVSEDARLDESLTEAVASLSTPAYNCGISLTRHSREHYTADVNPTLPFGLPREISAT